MFYAIAKNKIDLRGYRFEHRLEDIQTLNERALRGELHISAISIHACAYVAEKYALDTDVTWMVGNSPRSDVNPALEAGLHAVFVPHDMTWVLEHEELAAPMKAGQRLLKLDRFADLTAHF